MKQFILLVGNIGTGKTYYSEKFFPKNYRIVRPDEFHGDLEQKQNRMFREIKENLENNETTVLDGLNLERKQRQRLLYFTKNYENCKKTIYDFGPGNEKTLQRVIITRPELSEKEWRAIHDENVKIYEKPHINEGYDEVIDKSNFA